jgi:O-antigen/teichoic acid export membrane protein
MATAPDTRPADPAHTGERAQEVRRKAAAGALLLGARSLALRALGLTGNIVLARLLTPADFGVVAVGNVIITAGSTLTDGGLGAALVRGPTDPSREDLGTVTGFQFVGSLVVVAITGAVAAIIGGHAVVSLVIVCSLPILVLQTPAAIVLERNLEYRPMVMSEISQAVAYNVWAISSVAAFGAGVWGLATAAVVGALAATLTVTTLAPVGFVALRLSFSRLRPLLGFGVQFQAIDALGLVRDQGLNTLTGALGGLGTLGLWSMASRLLSPAALVFETLRRVSYPGMARLRDLGQDSRDLVHRSLALTCVAGTFVLAPLAGSARALVPALFGQRWAPCADTLSIVAWALMLSGPFSVAASGFLFAEGHIRDVTRTVLTHTIVGLAGAAALLPILGITALGYSYVAMAATDVVLFNAALRRNVQGLRPLRSLFAAIIVGTLGAVTGWVVTVLSGHNLLAAVSGGAAACAVVLVGHSLSGRATLMSLFGTASRAVQSAIGRV